MKYIARLWLFYLYPYLKQGAVICRSLRLRFQKYYPVVYGVSRADCHNEFVVRACAAEIVLEIGPKNELWFLKCQRNFIPDDKEMSVGEVDEDSHFYRPAVEYWVYM
jgi:hypothetical protein